MSRPLNPTDPTFGSATIEMSLSAQLNGDRGEDRPVGVANVTSPQNGEEARTKPTTGAITKEGLWHNWVATSSSGQ